MPGPGQGYKQFQNQEDPGQDGRDNAAYGLTGTDNTGSLYQPNNQPINAAGQQQMASGQPMAAPGQQQTVPGQHQMTTSQQQIVPGQQQMLPGQQQTVPRQHEMTTAQQQTVLGQQQTVPGQQLMTSGQQLNAYGQPMTAPGQQQMLARCQPMMTPAQAMLGPGQFGYNINPVLGQPGVQQEIQMMPPPEAVPGCPPGLEYLTQLDQLLVHQQVEIVEVLTGYHCPNKYVVKNTLGQQVYFALEESDECMRGCCGSARGFVIKLTDNLGQEVIRVHRDFKCCSGCCCLACSNTHCSVFIEVESPPGTSVGFIRQTLSWGPPHFDILNAENTCVLKIRGKCCRCQGAMCTDDIDFKILTNNLTTEIGKISKQWGGILKETYTQADNFGVEFPADMDVKTKALLLGSTFLIDFMFFENKPNPQHRHHHHQY